jgi:uncharacterized DUF497 family protein
MQTNIRFEYDRHQTSRKHGVSFDEASPAFSDTLGISMTIVLLVSG